MFPFKKKKSSPAKVIGICGIHHNVGVTHIALSLANYLCSRHNKRVAYVELNPTGEIRSLCTHQTGRDWFSLMGFSLYPEATFQKLSAILGNGYDYYILDMGTLTPNNCGELARCDKRLVVGDIAPWKRELFIRQWEPYLKNQIFDRHGVLLLGNSGIKETKIRVSIARDMTVLSVPFLKNPFHLTSIDFPFFEEILQSY